MLPILVDPTTLMRAFGSPLATAAVMVAAVAVTWAAARAQNLPPGVEQYASALSGIEHARGRQSLEDLFNLGSETGPRLQAYVNSLNGAEFKSLKNKMRGFVIVRGASPAVFPNGDFFLSLARKKGTRIDREFFQLYSRSEPASNGGQPAYVVARGAAPGCTRFDAPLMIALYRGWLGFRTAHPDDYAAAAQDEIDRLTTELKAGSCACGGKDTVVETLEKFVAAFPDVPIAPQLRRRIERVRSGSSRIQFNCKG